MKRTAPPIISPHSLARLTAWARLWLQWFGAVLTMLVDEDAAARQLDDMARFVSHLVVLHAAVLLRPERKCRPHHVRDRKPPGLLRAGIGSRLKRALRARTLVDRFVAVITVMRDLDAHVAAMAKRLKRGLTRLNGWTPKREHGAPALVMRALTPACAFDSS
jgi:hypothetical protein